MMGLLEENNLQVLSKKLNISDRHLRRIFNEELNVSPIDYIETSRLLLAKNLITDTDLSISDIAFASGYKSLRRFNDAFKNKYRIPPSHFRKENNKTNLENIILKIGYKEPFRYDALLRFLKHRIIPNVEKVENGKYYKTLCIKKESKYIDGYVVISNNQEKSVLEVTISDSLVRVLPQVLNIVKNMFDVNTDPYVVYECLKSANEIIPNSYKIGTRIPGSPNDFEMCVRAIIGQLISVEKATEVLSRFCKKFGRKIETNIKGLDFVFPTPDIISNLDNVYDELCSLKMTRTKADAIKGIADEIVYNELNFRNSINMEDNIKRMLNIKGIGKWTVDYISMRAMDNSDVLLDTDYAIKKIMNHYGIKDMSIFDKYKPYRTYLTIGLWEKKEEMFKSE